MTTRNTTPWTAAEDKTLRELVGVKSYVAIGELIGRKHSAVGYRAKQLGLSQYAHRGEKHRAARLSFLQARMVNTLLAAGFTAPDVKAVLNLPVAPAALRDIANGVTWGHATR